jgi:ABC transporter substrate binding protein (PQQ-dependent alcohol dehydrogenase system)
LDIRVRRFLALAALCLALLAGSCGSGKAAELSITFLERAASGARSIEDEGLAGARLGLADNAASGRFLGQAFTLKPLVLGRADDIAAAVRSTGAAFIVAKLEANALREAAAALPQGIIFNVAATDDALRNEYCAPSLLHTIPSRAMLADGLAQYLVWKRWKHWFLIVGSTDGDRLYADAVRRAAKKFGAEIAVEKMWTFGTPQARADTGHVTLQSEIPAFTRVGDHEVVVVADETDAFGENLMGRTALPRVIAGTHGLAAAGWNSVNQQWGATQLQSRFMKEFGRAMTPVDYAAWAAVRAIGEASLRTRSTDPATIAAYLRGPEFLLSGYKGQAQSFRPWDGQMRQPILIAGPRLLVSVSPQAGFLHQVSSLDTLGFDQTETRCSR